MATAIIGRKPARARPAPAPATVALDVAAAPAVRRVRIDDSGDGQRLDNFLVRLLKGVPKTHVYRVIRSGEVRVNKGRAQADTRLALGDDLRIPPVRIAAREHPAAAPAREFPVVFEDDALLVIDKPAGVAVHGGSGVAFGVIEQLRRARPEARFLELVHRLDRETSGLLMVAKKRAALLALQDQLRQHGGAKTIAKGYAALVAGAWPPQHKVIDIPLHKYLTADGERRVRAVAADRRGAGSGDRPDDATGRRAITLVRVARAFDALTLLEVTIKTGRTHQIRVHLAHAGHPIVGDEKYGDFTLNKAIARGFGPGGVRFERMFLHAQRLRFAHPTSGAAIELEAPLPAECSDLLASLGTPS